MNPGLPNNHPFPASSLFFFLLEPGPWKWGVGACGKPRSLRFSKERWAPALWRPRLRQRPCPSSRHPVRRVGGLDDLRICPDATPVPLSESGSKVLSSMKTQYGPTKGERIFYATGNKKPQLGAKWHGQTTSRPISKR